MSCCRLSSALIVSLLTHAALVLFAVPLVLPITPSSGNVILQVALEPAAVAETSTDSSPVETEKTLRFSGKRSGTTLEDIESVALTRDAPSTEQELPMLASADTNAVSDSEGEDAWESIELSDAGDVSGTESTGRMGEDPLAAVAAELRQAFETHFYYPLLARRKGWEGRVTMSVRVEADGRFSDIRVIESSGYRVLDSAAVDCLRRAARLSRAEGVIQTALDLVLPVRYLLLDSPA